MGHERGDRDMGANYRERVSDERLQAVVDVVHDWLFADSPADDDHDEYAGRAAVPERGCSMSELQTLSYELQELLQDLGVPDFDCACNGMRRARGFSESENWPPPLAYANPWLSRTRVQTVCAVLGKTQRHDGPRDRARHFQSACQSVGGVGG